MTTKAELEKLAEECQACADKDTASINEHLENCPLCKEHKKKAEGFNQMMEVIEMLASKPEEERAKILGARMEQFSEMPDDKRIEAIGEMLDAAGELPEDAMFKVVKTRTDIMTKLPKDKRMVLMGTLKQIMSKWPDDRKMLEKRAGMAATQDYFILKRMMVRNMFKKMLA